MMRKTARSRWLSADAAVLVALFLLVQALFSGLATGAEATGSRTGGRDIICRSRSGHDAPADPAADRSHGVDCCTLGCLMLSGTLPPPVKPGVCGHPQGLSASIPPAGGGAPLMRAELAPLRTRAPPAG